MMKCDLHTHTSYSDGSCTVRELFKLAKQLSIDVLAVTDHDNTDGLDEAALCAQETGIELVRGIEFSTYDEAEIHILGYGIAHKSERLQDAVQKLKQMRKERCDAIFDKLKKHGIHVEKGHIRHKFQGRVEVAKLLQEKGYVFSIGEAFDKYLGVGKPAYIAGARISAEEAITEIIAAGGLAVLAHPLNFLKNGSLEGMLMTLKDFGLAGIEAYYPTHSTGNVRELLRLAEKYGLIATGGSDFHGKNRPTPLGSVSVPLDAKAVERLHIQTHH